MLPFSLAAPLALMALLQAAAPAGMRTIDQGTISSVSTPKQEVVRTQEAFATLWTSHQRRRVVPRVDFEKEMIVALFQGSQPSAGYKVEVVSVVEEGGGPVVRYRETRPAAGEVAAQIVTAPYHIVAVPLIAGTPRFERVEN